MLVLWIKEEIIACTSTSAIAAAAAAAAATTATAAANTVGGGGGTGAGDGITTAPRTEGTDGGSGAAEEYFKGAKLVEILGVLMKVPDSFAASPEIILNEYDKIAAVCNLFLFILLRGSVTTLSHHPSSTD